MLRVGSAGCSIPRHRRRSAAGCSPGGAGSGSQTSIPEAAFLDAVARFLQDVAIEDVEETGWGMPEHLWLLRRIRIDVLEPFL